MRTFEPVKYLVQLQGLYAVTEQVHVCRDGIAKAVMSRYRSKLQIVSLVVVMDKKIRLPSISSPTLEFILASRESREYR